MTKLHCPAQLVPSVLSLTKYTLVVDLLGWLKPLVGLSHSSHHFVNLRGTGICKVGGLKVKSMTINSWWNHTNKYQVCLYLKVFNYTKAWCEYITTTHISLFTDIQYNILPSWKNNLKEGGSLIKIIKMGWRDGTRKRPRNNFLRFSPRPPFIHFKAKTLGPPQTSLYTIPLAMKWDKLLCYVSVGQRK